MPHRSPRADTEHIEFAVGEDSFECLNKPNITWPYGETVPIRQAHGVHGWLPTFLKHIASMLCVLRSLLSFDVRWPIA